MEHNTINNMKKALLIVCLFISVIASGQGNFFWSHNSSGGYGLLYNWYAATSTDKITSSDDWVVPNNTQWATLSTYLGGDAVAGDKLKKKGISNWISQGVGTTNEVLFSAVGSGIRISDFSQIKEYCFFWSTDISGPYAYRRRLIYSSSSFSEDIQNLYLGQSIRLLYVGVGTPTQYVGNNGYVYIVVQIGSQYWIAQNLRETKWRNGTDIPNVTDNTTWIGLTTPAWCVYDNNFKYR